VFATAAAPSSMSTQISVAIHQKPSLTIVLAVAFAVLNSKKHLWLIIVFYCKTSSYKDRLFLQYCQCCSI